MKIHERVKRGKKVWTVDGKINGKRQRSNFETKRAAEAYLKTVDKEPELSAWWAGLTLTDRFDLKAAFEIAQEDGFTLLAAAQNQAVSGRGQTHLKKMTLAEAIGSDGVWRFKDKSKAPKPSGYLGSMILRGIGQKSISVVKSPLNQFAEYAGGSSQCKAALTADKISAFLLANAGKWTREVRKQNRARMHTFCGWLVRQDVLASNPVEKIDKIESDGFDPYVLTPDECIETLKVCAAKHPIMLPLLVLNLFCGIRPSECQRLSTAKGRNSNFRWEDQEIVMQAKKTKTKMRRAVEMSDNCLAWLKLNEFSLPITNSAHQWTAFLKDAKKALGHDKWPHDCLRHSYCSYALRKYESAGKVALNAGNNEGTLYKHYLKAVTKAEAEAFWNILPEETLKAAA